MSYAGWQNMSAEAVDLVLSTENDQRLWEVRRPELARNLQKHQRRGLYDSALAVRLFHHFADEAAKKYHEQFGTPSDRWHDLFPVSVRLEAAQHWAETWQDWEIGGES